MSTWGAGSDAVRSDHDALIVTRALIIFGLAIFAVAGSTAAILVEGQPMTPVAWLVLLAAAGLIAAGLLVRSHPAGVWLAMMALTLPIGMWAAQGQPPNGWITIGIAYFEIVLILIAMVGRRTGLVIAAVSVGLVAVGSLSSPLSVVVGGTARWVGWIIVPQLAVASVWMWWAFWRLVRSADESDADLAGRRADLEQVQADRERVRVWRRAAARTHETVLNDLRYVLKSRVLDRERLSTHLESTRVQAVESDIPTDLAVLINSIAADASLGVPVSTATVEDGAILEPEQWRRVRSAVIEIIRNADRHGRVQRVELSTWTTRRTWFVTIEHEAGAGAPESTSSPGIGRSIVLDESLAEGGIQVSFTPGRTMLTGEVSRPTTDEPEPAIQEGARALLASVMAATSVGGLLYWVVPLLTGGGGNITLSVIGILTAVAAAGVSLRAHPLPSWLVVLLGTLCGVVPLLVATSSGPCLDLGMNVSVVFLSGYSLTAIVMWARHQWTWWVVTVWWVGLAVLVHGGLTGCAPPSLVLATSGVLAIPVYLVVAAIGRATAMVRWRRARATREERVLARARARAEADLARQLERRVEQARDLLQQIADGGDIDDTLRTRLGCLDAGIRAAVQVDPVTAGGFCLAARDLAVNASDRAIPVKVRALRDSSDPRPLAAEAVAILEHILLSGSAGSGGSAASGASAPTVQVVTDGRTDYLTVQAPTSAVTGAGLALDQVVDVNGVLMEAMTVEEGFEDPESGDPPCLVLVTRRVSRDVVTVDAMAHDVPTGADPPVRP